MFHYATIIPVHFFVRVVLLHFSFLLFSAPFVVSSFKYHVEDVKVYFSWEQPAVNRGNIISYSVVVKLDNEIISENNTGLTTNYTFGGDYYRLYTINVCLRLLLSQNSYSHSY